MSRGDYYPLRAFEKNDGLRSRSTSPSGRSMSNRSRSNSLERKNGSSLNRSYDQRNREMTAKWKEFINSRSNSVSHTKDGVSGGCGVCGIGVDSDGYCKNERCSEWMGPDNSSYRKCARCGKAKRSLEITRKHKYSVRASEEHDHNDACHHCGYCGPDAYDQYGSVPRSRSTSTERRSNNNGRSSSTERGSSSGTRDRSTSPGRGRGWGGNSSRWGGNSSRWGGNSSSSGNDHYGRRFFDDNGYDSSRHYGRYDHSRWSSQHEKNDNVTDKPFVSAAQAGPFTNSRGSKYTRPARSNSSSLTRI
jgi:hypothetical protein